MLARTLAKESRYNPEDVIDAYVHWYDSGPFDIGNATSTALGAASRGRTPHQRLRRAHDSANTGSQANGSLMRISPLGIFGWRRPDEAAAQAFTDSSITHPNNVCRVACAVFVRAVSAAVAGAGVKDSYEAAVAEAGARGNTLIQETLAAAQRTAREDAPGKWGWVLVALQNAFYQLRQAPSFEEGLVATVMQGGDTDTNAAICGALLGAVHGRESIPRSWRQLVLSCRPIPEAGAFHPRPVEFWPVDALELAERLLLAGE